MSRFLLFIGQTTITVFSFLALYIVSLHVLSGQPINRVLFRPTKNHTTNQALWHWKQNSLEHMSVILGSSMALHQVDPTIASTDEIHWNCFGVWGADPSSLFQHFKHHIGKPKNLIIPLSIYELSNEGSDQPWSTSDLELHAVLPIEPYSNLMEISKWTIGAGCSSTSTAPSLNFSQRGNLILTHPIGAPHLDSTRFSRKWNPQIHKAKSLIQFFRNLNLNVYFVFLPWHRSQQHEHLALWVKTISKDLDVINLSSLEFADSLYSDPVHRFHPCDSIIGLHIRDSIVAIESLQHQK